jgi:hypothetical protein
MTLSTFVALCSAVMSKPLQSQLVILGSMSLGGNIIPVENLAESLQVAHDAGAKRVLLPMASVSDIPTIPGELFAKFQTGFYSDPRDAAFKALLDHLIPGRWEDSRQPDPKETVATTVLAMPIAEASVKIRSGPPKDAAKDLELPYWTGVIPLRLTSGAAIPDPLMKEERSVPNYAVNYSRPS